MTTRLEEIFSFGTWVRRRRKALDLTQAAVADRVGCAEVTIRKLEADAFRPSREIAERLAICLEITADERTWFLQAARGERPVDQLPMPATPISVPLTSIAKVSLPGVPIPLDTVPSPAPLPAGSCMPLSRNPLFVGRDTDLRQIAQVFHTGMTPAIGHQEIAAATGLGGIGKTQLACEFIHRYGQFFSGGVFWLSLADPAAVPAEVAACGGVDGMQLRPDFGTLPLHEQIALVRAAWESPLPRLLVFDNCEDEALLEQWRPKTGGCRVLITSRRRHWDATLGVQTVPLDVLPRPESLVLLRQFRPDLPKDDASLQAIAAALGDLPLALHLAGSFLAKYRHALTPAQYLQRIQAATILDDRSLRAAGLSPTQHVQHVARTFEQSYERIDLADPTDALARTLLTRAACFAPGEPIPRWLLVETLGLPDENADRALLAEDALMRLIDLGLLETDVSGTLRLHRLLVAFVQAVVVDEAAQATVETTILRVVTDLNERRNPRPVLAVQPHLRHITEAARGRVDARTAALCRALGQHLQQLGVYEEAQGYHEQAVTIFEQVLGVDHPDTALSLHSLGIMLYEQGQYDAARRSYEQALAIFKRVFGMDHPHTALSLDTLGLVLAYQGEYAASQRYHEQALAIRQQVLGPDHPHTSRSLNNLGVVLYNQGQYAAARHSLEQALAILERVFGMDHPHSAMSLNNLGLVLHAQGQYAAARHSLEQALASYERVLGVDHPLTADCLNSLGVVFRLQGQYADAQRNHKQALAVFKRVLGMDHPLTALSLHSLGIVHQAQGQYAAAQDYHEQALAIRERVLGAEHPDTARSMHGLGEMLHTHGELSQARHYLERALAIFEQRLGSAHPDTEQTRRTLAALRSAVHQDDAGA
jgi:tetratricopeptide (TPR) repeat protein/transcriptional regulator with XRE-family HTH domain